MLVLLQAAFAQAWGRGFAWDNLTLRNFRFVLFDQTATRAVDRQHVRLRGGRRDHRARPGPRHRLHRGPAAGAVRPRADYVAMAPFVIPGIVLAIGFYAA